MLIVTSSLLALRYHCKLKLLRIMENMGDRLDNNETDQKNVMDNIKPQMNFTYNLQPGDKKLLQPFIYHTSVPGKNIRQKLIEVLNYWMDVPKDKLVIISEIIDSLHNMSLLFDDIQDNTLLRRGAPAAHTIFGITNVTNVCLFHGYGIWDTVLQLNHPNALRMHINANLELTRGQGMELYWRDQQICPTEKEYEQMVLKKTGGVFFLAKNLMQLFARKLVDVDILLTALTLYFQINDDYQNLKSDLFFHNKGFCEDLSEGKFGYPTMHAVNSNPEIGKEIIKILEKRTTDVDQKKHCLTLIESCGSFEYTRNKLTTLKTVLFKELKKLPDNPLLNGFLPKLISMK